MSESKPIRIFNLYLQAYPPTESKPFFIGEIKRIYSHIYLFFEFLFQTDPLFSVLGANKSDSYFFSKLI